MFYYLNNNDSSHLVPTITVSNDFELDNIKFIGFGGVSVNSKNSDTCIIENCMFQNSLGYALKINKENGENATKAIVTGCVFKECAVYTDFIVQLTSNFLGPACILMQRCWLSRYTDGNVNYKSYCRRSYKRHDNPEKCLVNIRAVHACSFFKLNWYASEKSVVNHAGKSKVDGNIREYE